MDRLSDFKLGMGVKLKRTGLRAGAASGGLKLQCIAIATFSSFKNIKGQFCSNVVQNLNTEHPKCSKRSRSRGQRSRSQRDITRTKIRKIINNSAKGRGTARLTDRQTKRPIALSNSVRCALIKLLLKRRQWRCIAT